MKRLTMHLEGTLDISCEACLGMQYYCVCEDCLRETIKRLAAIEDILGDDYDLDRFKEIVETDREGRCVVLPCKVGDHVVVLHNAKGAVPFVTSAVVAGMHIRDERARCGQFRKEYMVVRSNGFSKYISIDKMGKNVFLTKEEAEAALRRVQDEGVH